MSKIECTGKLSFFLKDLTTKHKNQSSWKYTAMVLLNDDTSKYYSWFINKRYNLKLNPPLRGPHFTIINDKMNPDDYKKLATEYDGKEITFTYDTDVRTNGDYWWLKAWSNDAIFIRNLVGLGDPYFGYHITIGYPNEKMEEHSHYIHRYIKSFENTILI